MKKKLIMVLALSILPFLIIIILATGLFGIVNFTGGIIKDAIGKKIAGVKDAVTGKLIEDQIDLADLSSYNLDELIKAVDDKKVFTDKMLDQMMIERDSLKEIFKACKEFNETYESADKKIQMKHTYTVTTTTSDDGTGGSEKKAAKNSKGSSGKSAGKSSGKSSSSGGSSGSTTQTETKVEYVYKDYPVSTKDYEYEFHSVNWQTVYITAIEETLQNYGKNYQLIEEGKNNSNSGILENTQEPDTEDSNGGEDSEEDSQADASSTTNTDLGPFKAGWVAQNKYEASQEKKYRKYIEKYAAMYNLPEDLIRAVITTESRWNPKATSSAGARGLCQVMPGTWTGYAVKMLGYGEEDIWNPEAQIHTCARILSEHFKTFNGDVILSISAYNQGGGNVKKWIKNNSVKTGTHLAYAATVITYFTGKKFTYTDLNNGNYVGGASIDVSVGFGTLGADGRISLTTDQIKELVMQFEPKYLYNFDVVRDEKMEYTYGECAALPNLGEQVTGDPSTESGQWSWYEPISSIDKVEGSWYDAIYKWPNIIENYVIRLDRWETVVRFYWNKYDGNWFKTLIRLLPNGMPIPKYYDYIASIATDIVEYDGKNAFLPENNAYNGAGTGSASGNYEPLTGVTPSIKIPNNCGGMSIPLYTQWDARWGRRPFGGGTISSSGCGATSVAMVISYLTKKCVYPNDIVDIIGNRYYDPGAGQRWEMIPAACKAFGCRAVQQTVNADAIVASLKAGHPVIVSTSGYGTTKEFTKHGHYICLRGLTKDGKVLVNDPNDNSTKKHYAKAYTPQFIYSECCSYGHPKVMFTIYGPGE